jgi:hypothetical protein
MTETEVFRIVPVVGDGKCYEYAEATRSEGIWPFVKYFTTNNLLYLGKIIRIETGGWRDAKWRKDYFEDDYGNEHIVNYSYSGTTCFREVPCDATIEENVGGKSRRRRRKTRRTRRTRNKRRNSKRKHN